MSKPNNQPSVKRGFTLYEPPPRVIVLPPDFKPYKEKTQKGVNSCLKFEFDNKLEWMDVANIIINTKKKEFMSIIELYRENHDRGFEENDIESLGGSKEYFKKKKKTRRGTNNQGDNSEKQTIKPLNVACANSPTSEQQNLNNNKIDNLAKELGRRSLVTIEQRELLANFRRTKEQQKRRNYILNDFERFLNSMKDNVKRNKSFSNSKSQTATQLNISMTQYNPNYNQKEICKIDKVHIKSKISLHEHLLSETLSGTDNEKMRKTSPHRSSVPHLYSGKHPNSENVNEPEPAFDRK